MKCTVVPVIFLVFIASAPLAAAQKAGTRSKAKQGNPQTKAGTSPTQTHREMKGHEDRVMGVAFIRDDKLLVSGSEDGTIRIWDVQTGRELRRAEVGSAVKSIAVTDDGSAIAAAIQGKSETTLSVFDVDNLKVGSTWQVPRADHVGISSNAKVVITDCLPATLWDAKTGREIFKLSGKDANWAFDVAISRDGNFVLTGGSPESGAVQLWDAGTGNNIATFNIHTGIVNAVAISATGETGASGSFDGTIGFWDLKNRREIKVLKRLPKN